MNLINKITLPVAALLILAITFGVGAARSGQAHAQSTSGSSATAQADGGSDSLDLQTFNNNLNGESASPDEAIDCAGVKIAFDVGCRDDFSNPILAYLVAILRFLTYGVGVVVIMMIIVGGIQYSAAGGNAQAVGAAKARILNAVIALILYIFAFAILNFVVPGGLIG